MHEVVLEIWFTKGLLIRCCMAVDYMAVFRMGRSQKNKQLERVVNLLSLVASVIIGMSMEALILWHVTKTVL